MSKAKGPQGWANLPGVRYLHYYVQHRSLCRRYCTFMPVVLTPDLRTIEEMRLDTIEQNHCPDCLTKLFNRRSRVPAHSARSPKE